MKCLILMLSCLCGFAQNPADLMATYQILYPTQVAGCMVWCESDFGVYSNTSGGLCTADGTFVNRWLDKSGSGNDLGQTRGAGYAPVYRLNVINGFPAIDFGTSSPYHLTNTWPSTISNAYTAFVVFYPSNVALGGTILDGRSAAERTYLQGQANVRVQMLVSGSSFYILPFLEPKQWHVTSAQYNGAASTGATFARNNGYYGTSVALTKSSGLQVGATYIPDQSLKGMVAAVVFYGRLLSYAEVRGVEYYLKQKYADPHPF